MKLGSNDAVGVELATPCKCGESERFTFQPQAPAAVDGIIVCTKCGATVGKWKKSGRVASALERAFTALGSLRALLTRHGVPPGGTHQAFDLVGTIELAVKELMDCHGVHNMGSDFRCTRCGKDSSSGERHREMTTLESQEAIVRRRMEKGPNIRDKKRGTSK